MTKKNKKIRAYALEKPVKLGGMNSLLGLLGSYWNGEYYETPLNLAGLADARTSIPYHESAMDVKRQMLMSTIKVIKPHLIDPDDVENLIDDLLWSGNYYLHKEDSLAQKLLKMRHIPALRIRRLKHPEDYGLLKHGIIKKKYKRKSILHVKKYDPKQSIYGMPGYLSAMNHAFLNKSSTVFRRKFIDNGGHMGFILYLNSARMEDDTIEDIEDAIYDASGDVGNLVIHDPSGDEGKIELIKVSDISTKDDFWNIQELTQKGVCAVHRVPDALMGIASPKGATAASPRETSQVFFQNELKYLQGKIEKINTFAGQTVITFEKYEIEDSSN